MENRVGFWPRVAASVIDFVLFMGIAIACKDVISSALPEAVARKVAEATANQPAGAPGMGFVAGMAAFGISSAVLGPFYGLIEAFVGASPGKLLLGQRIVTETGQAAPLPTLLLRYFVKTSGTWLGFIAVFVASKPLDIVSTVVAVIILLGFFLVLTSARQALHDKIAGTAVLRKSDVGATLPAGQPSGA